MIKGLYKDGSILGQLALILLTWYILTVPVYWLFGIIHSYFGESAPLILTSIYSIVVFGGGAFWISTLVSNAPKRYLGIRPYRIKFNESIVLGLSFIACLLVVGIAANGIEWVVSYLPSNWQKILRSSGDSYMQQINQMAKESGAFALIYMAIIPGITEELFFRGAIFHWMRRVTNNRLHATVWLTAVVFSTIHFDFMGFVPRILLGAYLGYVYHYSRSIYVPIFLHILNNSVALWSLFLNK